jgi:hypothetical protein
MRVIAKVKETMMTTMTTPLARIRVYYPAVYYGGLLVFYQEAATPKIDAGLPIMIEMAVVVSQANFHHLFR